MLQTIDLSRSLDQNEYIKSLKKYQAVLSALSYQVYVQQRSVVIVFEGWDAAGKGDTIRQVTEKLDPRGYVVYPIAAPEGEDATHHYMRRFWRRLPEAGQIAIFDRSWYGRVLVDRVDGYCTGAEWKRAYREINQFERQLVDFGTILFKFWIHISKKEQYRRFKSREKDKLRKWKLTDNDWRNREKWNLYENAVNEMLLKTNLVSAQWTILEGDSKLYSQVKVLQTLVDVLSERLNHTPLDGDGSRAGGKKKSPKGKKKKRKNSE